MITQSIALLLLAAVAEYEAPGSWAASSLLTASERSGSGFQVDETVSSDGFMYHFTVLTPAGDFEADGRRMLAIRTHEAQAIAELAAIEKSDIFIDAASRAVQQPIDAVGQFADAPVETVKGIPGGIARKFRGLKRSVSKGAAAAGEVREEGVDTGETVAAAQTYALKYFGVTGAERRWAQQLGVDPYTDNAVLRERIKKVARVDAAASFGAKLAMPGLGAVGYVVSAASLVWGTDAEELRAKNLASLVEAGVSQEAIDAFLDNPVLAPTHQTIMVLALTEMTAVANLEALVTGAGWAETYDDAWFYTDMVRAMAGLYQQQDFVEFVEASPLPGVLTRSGSAAFILPVDYLSWNETLHEAVTDGFLNAASDAPGGRQLWISGAATPVSGAELRERGWEIRTLSELPGITDGQ